MIIHVVDVDTQALEFVDLTLAVIIDAKFQVQGASFVICLFDYDTGLTVSIILYIVSFMVHVGIILDDDQDGILLMPVNTGDMGTAGFESFLFETFQASFGIL